MGLQISSIFGRGKVNSIAEGSLWISERQYGLQILEYEEKTSIYVQHGASAGNIINIKPKAYIQFLEYKHRKVRNNTLNQVLYCHVVSILLIESMTKAVIAIQTQESWEKWWLATFTPVSI